MLGQATQQIQNFKDKVFGFANTLFFNKMDRDYQDHVYGKMRADALADWNMVNEYNSPKAQMQRFKDAGLNENLIYGQMTNSPSVRSTDAPSWHPTIPKLDMNTDLFGGFYDMSLKGAQVDNVQAMTDVAKQEAIVKAAQAYGLALDNMKKPVDIDKAKLDLQFARDNYVTSLEQARENLRSTRANITSTETGTDIALQRNEREIVSNAMSLQEAAERILKSRAERSKVPSEIAHYQALIKNLGKDWELKELDRKLKETGAQPSDNAALRVLAKYLDKLDPKFLERSSQGLKKFAADVLSGKIRF